MVRASTVGPSHAHGDCHVLLWKHHEHEVHELQPGQEPKAHVGAPQESNEQGLPLYYRVGGTRFFTDLVEHFYTGVERDPVLRPMYPEDLGPSKAHLAAFLAQYFGGPPNYSMERGHPRLRMRHAPFPINRAARDAWVRHMADAVRAMDPAPRDAAELLAYFEYTATFLINQPD